MLAKRTGAVILASLVLGLAYYSATHPVDFPLYYQAGAQILDGDFNIYGGTDNTGHHFRSAPVVALLFAPLAWLPLPLAAFLFFCLKVVAFLYIGRTILRHAGVPAPYSRILLAAFLIVGGYLIEELRNGNLHLLAVGLMVLAFDHAERGRVAVPAGALALAIAAKLTPVLLLGYFALRRRFALCGATLAALAVLWVVPAAVTGVSENTRLTGDFFRSAGQMADASGNYSLRGAVFRYLTWDEVADPRNPRPSVAALTSDTATTIWLVLLCAGGAWMALTLWRAPSVSGVPVLEFSVVLIAMLLAAPHAQRQYFSALIVPVLVALGMVVQKSAASRGLPVALAATVATGTVLPLILGSRRLAVMYEASSPYFFGALLLFGVLLTVTARLKAPLKIGADAPLRAVNAATMWGAAAAVFALVFVFRLLHVQFTDDHFDRISRGRQILAAGDVPFRDFFDPGFLLTSYSSAAMQRLFGYNLLGEALLTICFIAAGFAIAVVLGWKISRSWPAAVIATAIGAAMLPRLYNYDKVLFLPLGALACWSYAARPSHRRLMAIAGIIVLAAMYRADNGLYLAAGAIAAIVSVQWGAWRSMLRHASTLGAFVLVFSIPVLAFLQSTAGVPEAARQVLEYAQREGRRTDIFSAPRLAVDRHAPWRTLGAPVNVRWQADVDQARRGALEQAFHLERGDFAGGRTWRYWLTDASATNVKTLVGDPAVEDTHGLLTTAGTYEAVPTVSVLPGVLTEANAAAWLYYALLALAILGTTAGCRSADRTTRAALVSCGALLLTAHLFLLRSPLEARVGDVAAAAVPLAAWALTSSWQQRGKGLMAGVTILCTAGLIVTTLAVSVLAGPMLRAPIDREGLARLAASPPPIALMPAGRAAGVVEYLRECTSPEDRVLVTWFAPDLHFFSGRAFAGGMNVIFGGHWSSEADQQAILARLQSQPVPVAVVELDTYPEFRTDFPGIDRYLQSEYSTVADHTFGSTEGTYRLFIRNGTPISGVDSRWGLPCAVGSRQ